MAVSEINPLCNSLAIELRKLSTLEPDPHRAKAYQKAATVLLENIEQFDSLMIDKDFKSLPGIGDSINRKIEEFLMTGHISKLKELESA